MGEKFSIAAIFKAIDKFSGPVARMTTRMDRFTRRVRKGMGGLGKMTKRVARGMRSLALTTGSLAVLGGYALKGLLGPAAAFEHAMGGVNAVTLGAYKEHMPAMAKEAKRLGAITTFTASRVAEAMEILARAGLEPAEILSAIEPILRSAEAGAAGIEETAQVIVASMKGMDKPFAETREAADIFAKVAASAKTTINELGEGLSKVAPVAQQFGLDFGDMVATVATLQDVGIEASMSGTQLKTMLTKLAMLTPMAARRFKQLGIEISDGNGNMKQMPELIAAIAEGLSRAGGNMEKVKAIAIAVGLRGSTAAQQLAASWEKGEKGIQGLLDKIRGADGAAQLMSELRLDTLHGDLVKLKSAWEGFRIDIGTGQLPQLRTFVQSLTELLTNPANIEKFAGYMNSAVTAVRGFWNNNKELIKAFATFMGNMAKMAFGVVKVVWTILGPVRSLITYFFTVINFLVDKLFRVLGWVGESWVGRKLGDMFDWFDAAGGGDSPGANTSVLGLPPGGMSGGDGNFSGELLIRNETGQPIGVESVSGNMSIAIAPSGGGSSGGW